MPRSKVLRQRSNASSGSDCRGSRTGFPLLCAAFLLLLCTPAWAAGPQPEAGGAEALLEELRQAQEGLESMRARFSKTRRFVHFGEEETQRGTLLYKKGRGVRIDYDAPSSEVVIVAEGHALIFNPRAKQLTRYELSESDSGSNPLWPFVPGPAPEGVERLERIESEDGLEGILVVRSPGASRDPYPQRRVFIDPADHLPRRIELTDAAEDLIIFLLTEIEPDARLEDGVFRFKPPKGTEIMERSDPLSF
jgi:outer membrane lipoprotein-sorting protein